MVFLHLHPIQATPSSLHNFYLSLSHSLYHECFGFDFHEFHEDWRNSLIPPVVCIQMNNNHLKLNKNGTSSDTLYNTTSILGVTKNNF